MAQTLIPAWPVGILTDDDDRDRDRQENAEAPRSLRVEDPLRNQTLKVRTVVQTGNAPA